MNIQVTSKNSEIRVGSVLVEHERAYLVVKDSISLKYMLVNLSMGYVLHESKDTIEELVDYYLGDHTIYSPEEVSLQVGVNND